MTPTASRVPAAKPAAPMSPQQLNYQRIGDLIRGRKDELGKLLKNIMTPERMIRIALSDVARNPTLLACLPESIANCLMVGAQFGLVVGGPLAEVYMIPRRNKHKGGAWCAEPTIGYRGYCRLAQRSSGLKRLDAHAVYEGEEFSYDIATGVIVHKWSSRVDHSPAKITEVYALAELADGTRWVEVMDRASVERRRKVSSAGSSGPWVDWWDKMALKTVILSLLRGGRVPLSLELAEALEADGEDEIVRPAELVEFTLPDAAPESDVVQEEPEQPPVQEAPATRRTPRQAAASSEGQKRDTAAPPAAAAKPPREPGMDDEPDEIPLEPPQRRDDGS